jgi:arylsulfatase A-like enzyme
MNSKLLLFLVLFFSVTACKKNDSETLCPSPSARPNILLIIADDQGTDAAPGYAQGNIKPHMPHLEAMISSGITYDNVWAYPLCSPTRASILTGRYSHRTGVLNANEASTIPANELTIQSYLNQHTSSAYSHAIIGKWHLSMNEPERPTQMGVGYYAGLLGGAASDYNNWPLTQNGQTGPYTGYITTKISDLAIDWLADQNGPWFCWLAYTAPHTPFHLPPTYMHSQGDLPQDQGSIDANPEPYFMAMCESVDYEMGRVISSIPQDQLANTIIIYIGDNGTASDVIQAPYTALQGKGSLFQGGVHVPMVISGTGVTRVNEHDSTLISSADLFATIANIAGVSVSQYEDSYSFKPSLTALSEGIRAYNYAEVLDANPMRSGHTIRNKRYKLINLDSGLQRFYDLMIDPFEQDNLMISPLSDSQSLAFQQLTTALAEIRQ